MGCMYRKYSISIYIYTTLYFTFLPSFHQSSSQSCSKQIQILNSSNVVTGTVTLPD